MDFYVQNELTCLRQHLIELISWLLRGKVDHRNVRYHDTMQLCSYMP